MYLEAAEFNAQKRSENRGQGLVHRGALVTGGCAHVSHADRDAEITQLGGGERGVHQHLRANKTMTWNRGGGVRARRGDVLVAALTLWLFTSR